MIQYSYLLLEVLLVYHLIRKLFQSLSNSMLDIFYRVKVGDLWKPEILRDPIFINLQKVNEKVGKFSTSDKKIIT